MLMTVVLTMLVGAVSPTASEWKIISPSTNERLRGLCAVNNGIIWASGTHGIYCRTTDAGETWKEGTVPDAETLDFRDVEAFSANIAYLLSTGEGDKSTIYKTTDGGLNWKLQFKNSNRKAFFDAIAFWDVNTGVAISDPVDGAFILLRTTDGGATWQELPREKLPAALPGEAAFAASGSCLITQGRSNAWFATGGAAARVFRTTDSGSTWSVSATPIFTDGDSSGIFSIAFRDPKNGLIVGGDYKKEVEARDNVARTTDGGKTWKLVKGLSGYRSCVAFAPAAQEFAIAVGPSGTDASRDDGKTWSPLDNRGFDTVRFPPGGAAIASGDRGRIAVLGH